MRADSSYYQDWLQKAENDLKAAIGILGYYEDPPTDTICYHCHQTAEKALKGFLVKNGAGNPKSHDLIELVNLAVNINQKLSEHKEDLEVLNKYFIEAKYPSDLPIPYPKNEAQEAVKKAETILSQIKILCSR
ncbi:MAG: HEPN domain-containing protein [Candidatus Margulisiibacteriota bacterium]